MTPSERHLRESLRGSTASSIRKRIWQRLPLREVTDLNRDWRHYAREAQQLPPDGEDWRSWLILGGRGAGKTRAGAEWVRAQALGLWQAKGLPVAERIALIAPKGQMSSSAAAASGAMTAASQMTAIRIG